jgi:hypothetical protein
MPLSPQPGPGLSITQPRILDLEIASRSTLPRFPAKPTPRYQHATRCHGLLSIFCPYLFPIYLLVFSQIEKWYKMEIIQSLLDWQRLGKTEVPTVAVMTCCITSQKQCHLLTKLKRWNNTRFTFLLWILESVRHEIQFQRRCGVRAL